MFPLSDDNSDRRLTPWINYLLIAINVIVFVLLQQMGDNPVFDGTFSAVPQEIITGRDASGSYQIMDSANGHMTPITIYPTPISVYLTLLTSMFMHGGWAHIGGNMLYLWIFGDNIEDAMGHFKYLLYYLLCGIVAGLSHVYSTVILGLNPMIPSLGASGAISGVLGGYILLYPTRRVTVILGRQLMQVPAYVALGLWIALQAIESSGLLGSSSGVAYGAHIGGFIAGVVLVKLFASQARES